jgi:archaemetzincin
MLALLVSCSGHEHLSRRGPIVLLPIGPVPADLLTQLRNELPGIIKRDVAIGVPIPAPVAAFDVSRQQYRGSLLLEVVSRHDIAGADRVVGIIDADAYAPGLNFIFGQAMKPGRFAVVALPRLRDSFRGRPENPTRFRERAVKETVHEIGHSFGLEHCEDRKCVMHFSNSFGDTDYKSSRFCSREQLPR